MPVLAGEHPSGSPLSGQVEGGRRSRRASEGAGFPTRHHFVPLDGILHRHLPPSMPNRHVPPPPGRIRTGRGGAWNGARAGRAGGAVGPWRVAHGGTRAANRASAGGGRGQASAGGRGPVAGSPPSPAPGPTADRRARPRRTRAQRVGVGMMSFWPARTICCGPSQGLRATTRSSGTPNQCTMLQRLSPARIV